MPVTTKRAKVKLPFFTFHVPVGWEAKPLTPAQRRKRKADKEKARQDRAKAAQKAVQDHEKAKRAASKPAAPTAATAQPAPRSTVGAAVLPPQGRVAGAKRTAAKRTAPSGQLCGQANKTTGGTCKRVVATKPCPDHPQGRPAVTP